MDWAFNLQRGPALREKWALIPEGTDVLITHGPPFGILDWTARGERVGCEDLLEAVRRVKPRLHVFGHIHEGYGEHEQDGTRFVNASICTEAYQPTNAPIVVDV
jgi:Icc-related predicted phosphoesterase